VFGGKGVTVGDKGGGLPARRVGEEGCEGGYGVGKLDECVVSLVLCVVEFEWARSKALKERGSSEPGSGCVTRNGVAYLRGKIERGRSCVVMLSSLRFEIDTNYRLSHN
jgi:hypothetical protein